MAKLRYGFVDKIFFPALKQLVQLHSDLLCTVKAHRAPRADRIDNRSGEGVERLPPACRPTGWKRARSLRLGECDL